MERLTRRLTPGDRMSRGTTLAGVREQDCVDKLAWYEDAEEDGRIFRADFKPGDTAYIVEKSKSIFDGNICWIVEEIDILDVSAGGFITDDVERYIWYDLSDGMIFKTEEEAKEALKKREEEPDELEDDDCYE